MRRRLEIRDGGSMFIDLEIENFDENREKVTVRVKNGLCDFAGFDLLTHDAIETLELELTTIVQKLQNHRRTTCQDTK